MNDQSAPLSYATPATRVVLPRALILMLSTAIAFVGGNALATAAGFPEIKWTNPEPPAVFAWLISLVLLFFLATAILIWLAHRVMDLNAWMSHPSTRVSQAICLTLIICGTVCVLAAGIIEVLQLETVPPINNVPQAFEPTRAGIIKQASFFGSLLAVAILIIGVAQLVIAVKSTSSAPQSSGPPHDSVHS